MKPGPFCAFAILCKLCAMALVVLAWAAGWPWGLALGTLGLLALGRVPRRRLLIELVLLLAVLGLLVHPGEIVLAPLAAAAVALLSLALAPESAVLHLNGMDRFFVAQDYPGTPTNSSVVFELSAPLDRRALEAAVADLHSEVPMLRSFVRESAFGIERFVARRPWAGDLLRWMDIPVGSDDNAAMREHFDLARQPPFRVLHGLERDGSARLVMTTHHSAFDGQGMMIGADWLVQRYNDRRSGGALRPLALTKEGIRLRDVVRARGKSRLWLWKMVRKHVKPQGKVGERNAELHDDIEAPGLSTRVFDDWLEPEQWKALSRLTSGQELTRNDLLVAASLRAADRYRRERGREDLPFRVLLPANLRQQLGLEAGLQNFLGVVNATFTPEEVRAPDLARLVHARIQHGRELEDVIETPIHLGVMSLVLPPWLLRAALRKLDLAKGDNYFSFIFSHWRNPPLPPIEGVTVQRVVLRGSLSRRPPIGLFLVPERDGLAVLLEYRYPVVRDESAGALAQAFRTEIEHMLASADAAQTPTTMRAVSPRSPMPSG